MSWRDDLRPASFRGVPFEVASHETPTGRRLVVEVYPERDTPGSQDMGANRGEPIRIDAFVGGPDYMPRRNALIDALERGTPGELVHPYYGRLWVAVGPCSWSETAGAGGVATFSLVFHVRGEIERSVERVVTPAAAVAAATAAEDAASEEFWSSYSAAAGLSASTSRLAQQFLIADLTGLYLPIGRSIQQASKDFTAGLFMSVIALSLTTYDLAIGLASRPALPFFGAAPAAALRAWEAYQRMISLVGVRRAVEIATSTTYTASDDAEAAEAGIVSAVAALEGRANTPPEMLVLLRDIRTVVVQVIGNRAALLPRLTTIEVAEPLPAAVLAWNLYGDADRADEIVARNGIANPGFCSGALTVLAS